MLRVEIMSEQDFPFAVEITDRVNWGMIEEDFKFMVRLEPEGCFVLFSDQERIGIATTVSFGKKAWFGNLIVKESHRKKGAGSLLVEHSVDYLKSKGVETIGLYAYMNKINFYRRLGFEYDSEFVVLKGKGFPSATKESVALARKGNAQQIINLDKVCFNASRSKTLEPILGNPSNIGYVCAEDGKLIGYMLAKAYDGIADLGPAVCPKGRGDLAISLLGATIGRLGGAEITLCLPRNEKSLLQWLMEHGFVEDFAVARMFRGPARVGNCIYVAESLERG